MRRTQLVETEQSFLAVTAPSRIRLR
jgi:hypothetical protein